jgi:L-iditol 2-dehydrogenase
MACPQIESDEVLILVHACGICGSDLKIQEDKHPVAPPVIIGHEFAGEIVETGSRVSGWAVGDRVVSEQHIGACGRCRQCLTGNAFACASKRAPGYFTDGRLPNSSRFQRGCCASRGVEFCRASSPNLRRWGAWRATARIEPGNIVLVLGCGPIGLVAARMAQIVGASQVIIAGIERDEQARLPKARELGIDHVVNVTQTDLEEAVAHLTGGEGADVVIELSGARPAIQQSFRLARRLGKVGIVGQPPADEVSIPYREALFRALTVSFSYSSKHASWERTLDMFERRVISPTQFITHVLPLSEWERGFTLARSGEAVKVVLEIHCPEQYRVKLSPSANAFNALTVLCGASAPAPVTPRSRHC